MESYHRHTHQSRILKYFHTQKHPGHRLTHFLDDISHFDVKIIYRPGRSQIAADALSQRDALPPVPDSESYQSLFSYPVEAYPASAKDKTETDRLCIFDTTFKMLASYLTALRKGADPSTVGNGHYSLQFNLFWKTISSEDEPSHVVVPTT